MIFKIDPGVLLLALWQGTAVCLLPRATRTFILILVTIPYTDGALTIMIVRKGGHSLHLVVPDCVPVQLQYTPVLRPESGIWGKNARYINNAMIKVISNVDSFSGACLISC